MDWYNAERRFIYSTPTLKMRSKWIEMIEANQTTKYLNNEIKSARKGKKKKKVRKTAS